MRRRVLPFLAVVALIVVAACGGDDEPTTGSVRSVTLVLDWTPNTNHGGIFLAAANGWYDDAGIDLEIVQPGETGGLQAAAAGAAEFAISVQESIVPAQAQGVPVVSVAAIVQHNTSSLLALASSGIEDPADLPGRRYGGFGGQLEQALIKRLVECAGGDPSGVEVVEVGNTDYRLGMERGDFDVVWIFDGWDKLRLEQAGVEVTTIPFIEHTDCIPDWYTPLIATSSALAEDDPELVAAFLEATARGYQAAIDDPTAAADALLAAAPELDERLVYASAEYLADQFQADAEQWGVQSERVWSEFVEFLLTAGLIESSPSMADAYTNKFLPDS